MSSKLCPLANSQPTICCFHMHTWNNGLAINMLSEYIFTLLKQWNYGLDFAGPQGLIFNRAQWITVKSLCPDIYCLQGHSQMCLLAVKAVADVLTVSKVSYKIHHQRKVLHLHLLSQQLALLLEEGKGEPQNVVSKLLVYFFWDFPDIMLFSVNAVCSLSLL